MFSKRLIFLSACFGMLLFGIGLITLGSMAPDLKEKFQLDEVAAGTLFSILPVGILVGSLLFGPVCDRYGYKMMLIASCALMFAGFEGIALLSSFTWLRIFIFLFGIGAGIINGATNAVVSDISKGSEGARLSLLGVFFGVGALGMPFIIGILKNTMSSFQIVQVVGWLTIAAGIFYAAIRFPPAKYAESGERRVESGEPADISGLFRENYLYFIAFYLFFQGSVEAILNNWTTSYLTQHLGVDESRALYALTLYVVGMTVMRLLIASVFRNVKLPVLMFVSILLVLAGIIFIHLGQSYGFSVAGLVLMGIGLAAGFPIMLGLAGNRYAAQSGTAFSVIFTVALTGNMLVNYLMGVISENYGILHFTTVMFVELGFMVVLYVLIFRRRASSE